MNIIFQPVFEILTYADILLLLVSDRMVVFWNKKSNLGIK